MKLSGGYNNEFEMIHMHKSDTMMHYTYVHLILFVIK